VGGEGGGDIRLGQYFASSYKKGWVNKDNIMDTQESYLHLHV